MDKKTLWETVLAQIQLNVSPANFATWFKNTEILSQNPLTIALKSPAEQNKANIELIKFLTRLTKKKIKIIKGLKSKTKVVEIK